jgi:hypothetical protein
MAAQSTFRFINTLSPLVRSPRADIVLNSARPQLGREEEEDRVNVEVEMYIHNIFLQLQDMLSFPPLQQWSSQNPGGIIMSQQQ